VPSAGLDTLARAITIGEGLPPSVDYIRALRDCAAIHRHDGHFEPECALADKGLEAAREIGALNEQKLLGVQLAWSRAVLGEDLTAACSELEAANAIDSDDPAVHVEASVGYTDPVVKLGDLQRAVEVGLPDCPLSGAVATCFRHLQCACRP